MSGVVAVQAANEAAFRAAAAPLGLKVGEADAAGHLPLCLTTPFYTVEGSIDRWVVGWTEPVDRLASRCVTTLMQHATNTLIGTRVYR